MYVYRCEGYQAFKARAACGAERKKKNDNNNNKKKEVRFQPNISICTQHKNAHHIFF